MKAQKLGAAQNSLNTSREDQQSQDTHTPDVDANIIECINAGNEDDLPLFYTGNCTDNGLHGDSNDFNEQNSQDIYNTRMSMMNTTFKM